MSPEKSNHPESNILEDAFHLLGAIREVSYLEDPGERKVFLTPIVTNWFRRSPQHMAIAVKMLVVRELILLSSNRYFVLMI